MTAMNENIELMMPIKAAPYDHQKKAFAFACDKFGVFDERLKSRGTALLMEMGTGKTIVSIAVAGCMYQYGKVNRVLVVAPLSILGVWEEEFEKFADFPYSLTILKGTLAKKKEQLVKLPDGGLEGRGREFASPANGRKDEMMQTLKENGYSSLVTETVNANTLASFMAGGDEGTGRKEDVF